MPRSLAFTSGTDLHALIMLKTEQQTIPLRTKVVGLC
jgi:hypothetical protein